MPIPKKVQEQVELADKIESDLNRKTPEAPAEPQETPAAPVAQEVPQVEPPKAVEAKEDFEHKYRVLQGKYNAETRTMREQIAKMQEQLKELTEKPKEPEPKASRVTDEERKEYGEEFIGMVGRAAEDVVAGVKADVTKQMEEIRKENLRQMQGRFYNDLSALVPNWREINEHPEFLGWLDRPASELSRRSRFDDLQEAFQELDSERVGAFFRTWASSQAKPAAPSKREIETPAPAAAKEPPAGESQKKVWTSREVAAFYNDLRSGVYEGREKEANEIEREIYSAQREGRIKRAA